jgi:hypothetical protein
MNCPMKLTRANDAFASDDATTWVFLTDADVASLEKVAPVFLLAFSAAECAPWLGTRRPLSVVVTQNLPN